MDKNLSFTEMEIDEGTSGSDSEVDTSSALIIHHSDLSDLSLGEEERGRSLSPQKKRAFLLPGSPTSSVVSTASRRSTTKSKRRLAALVPLEPVASTSTSSFMSTAFQGADSSETSIDPDEEIKKATEQYLLGYQ